MMSDSMPASSKDTRAIAEAVRSIAVDQTEAWTGLDILSPATRVEAVEVFEEEIRSDGVQYRGPVNIHVTLEYPGNFTLSETFPGQFEARLEGGRPRVDRLEVDTTSFMGWSR